MHFLLSTCIVSNSAPRGPSEHKTILCGIHTTQFLNIHIPFSHHMESFHFGFYILSDALLFHFLHFSPISYSISSFSLSFIHMHRSFVFCVWMPERIALLAYISRDTASRWLKRIKLRKILYQKIIVLRMKGCLPLHFYFFKQCLFTFCLIRLYHNQTYNTNIVSFYIPAVQLKLSIQNANIWIKFNWFCLIEVLWGRC